MDREEGRKLIEKLCRPCEGEGEGGFEQIVTGPSTTAEAADEKSETSLEDLETIRTIGTGTFGVVRLVRDRRTGTHYALKVMKKSDVVRLRQVEHVHNERGVLSSIQPGHPFIVKLLRTFQDESRLYMLLEYVRGGELFRRLRLVRRFTKAEAVFYAAEVVCALDSLHAAGIVYRDLKPENILIDSEGHIRVTDFGFSKFLGRESRTWTLCGTPEYLSPEVIQGTGHGKGTDWWSLGILIFEMLSGRPPFVGRSCFETYESILEGSLKFPEEDGCFDDEPSRDIITKLLERDKSRRLGCGRADARDVMQHRFFAGIDWSVVPRRGLTPPFVPVAPSDGDSSNFDIYPDEPEYCDSKFRGKIDDDLFAGF